MREATSALDPILRLPEILRVLKVSKTTLYRWCATGNFPRPLQLSSNIVGWRESEVREWLESRRPAGSDPAPVDEPPEASTPREGDR